MQVDFYHLGASAVEQVLTRLAERIVADGGRLLVVADGALAVRIDEALWDYSAESFLPHARAGSPDDAAQPVLIAPAVASANCARNVALADGVWRDAALEFDRVFHLFGDAEIAAARVAWKALTKRDDVEPRFWRQDEGGRWRRQS